MLFPDSQTDRMQLRKNQHISTVKGLNMFYSVLDELLVERHCLGLCVQLWAEYGVRLLPTPFSHKGAALGRVCWLYASKYEKGKANNLPVPPTCYRLTLRPLNAGCHYKHELRSIFNDKLFLESTWNDSALPGRNLLIWSQAGGVSSLTSEWLVVGLRMGFVDCW